MGLDLHLAWFEADERVRDGACEHAATVRVKVARVCVRSATTYQHVFEELTGAAAGATIHVPAQTFFETEAGALEDLREQIAAVVDHDDHRRPAT